MSKLEKAAAAGGSIAFVMKYMPGFPAEFLVAPNPFSSDSSVLMSDIIHPDDYQPFCEMVNDLISGRREDFKVHARLVTDEGYKWFYISALSQRDTSGTLEEIMGQMFDVSAYLETCEEDAVMIRLRRKSGEHFNAAHNVPQLRDVLGEEYLIRIQQPFAHIKGLYSAIVDSEGRVIAAAGQDKHSNPNKMSYQRKKNIRLRHQTAATWIIAGEDESQVNSGAELLDTMVQTVSDIANSYVVICEEMENSQNANKLLGQNFEDQILINNIYSMVLQSADTVSAISGVSGLIKSYFSLDELIFCSNNERPYKAYRWDASGVLIPFLHDVDGNDEVHKTLEFENIACATENDLDHTKTGGRSCLLSTISYGGDKRGVIVYVANAAGRAWTNREKKQLKNVTQIISTIVYKYFAENELAASRQHLARLAYYDTTTGLPNRSGFERDFAEIDDKNNSAVIAIEISNLKSLSEIFGGDAGDDIIRSVAEYISAIPNVEIDRVYRYANDMLIAAISDISEKEVRAAAESLLAKFRSPWYLNDNEYQLDMYGGIIMLPTDVDNVHDCETAAVRSIRLAKEKGRHTVMSYSDGLGEQLKASQRIKRLIMEAVEDNFNGFYFLYTPIMDARTGALRCCEANLFWSNGELVVARDRFLPIVDSMGYSAEIYEYVVMRVCEFCAAVRELGTEGFRVCFAIPENIISSEKSVEILRSGLLEYSLPPGAISISVSEAAGTLSAENVYLTQLAKLGVNIVCEDKGGGVISTAPLNNPLVKTMKIRCRRMTDEPVSSEFMRSLVKRAHDKGIVVCAKSVDNKAAFDRVRGYDVDLVEGIFNGRPLHTADFIERLVVNKNIYTERY